MSPTSETSHRYVLNERGEPVPEPDLTRWASWYESTFTGDKERNPRRVALSRVGDWEVSTVFLALDHGYGTSRPILWETMVFGPEPWGDWCDRFETRAAAEYAHAEIVQRLIDGEPLPGY